MSFRALLIVGLVVLTRAKQHHDVISGQGVVWQPPRFPPKDRFDHDPERHRLALGDEDDCASLSRAIDTAIANFSSCQVSSHILIYLNGGLFSKSKYPGGQNL